MTEKVTFQTKIKYIENKIQKQCIIHKREASVFCIKLGCYKCPYICPLCIRENIHGHNQQIYEGTEFIRRLCSMIEDNKRKMNKILDTGDRNSEWSMNEQIKSLQQIQTLQAQIMSIFEESKRKIKMILERSVNKNCCQSIKFYANPNLIVNKIISDPSFHFITFLKQTLSETKSQTKQNQNQILQLKLKIKQLISVNHQPLFPKQQKRQKCEVKPTLKQTFGVGDYPLDIFSTLENILVPMSRQTYCLNVLQKTKNQTINTSLSKIAKSNLINDSSFIGINYLGLLSLFTNNKIVKTIPLSSTLTALGYLASYSKRYALLGMENGVLQVLDIQLNQPIYKHNQPSNILSIQIYQRNTIILCSRENSTIDIYKYRHEYESFVFQYQSQLSLKFQPISFIRVYDHELILFGQCRNILIYDLMMSCEVLRSNFSDKAPEFRHVCMVQTDDLNMILTVSSGEKHIYSWIVDRNKKSLNVNPVFLPYKQNKQGQIKGLQYMNDCLWIIQNGEKALFTFSIY